MQILNDLMDSFAEHACGHSIELKISLLKTLCFPRTFYDLQNKMKNVVMDMAAGTRENEAKQDFLLNV